MGYLFQHPISNFIDEKIQETKSRAQNLTADQLQDPSLAGILEQISDFQFELATLKPEGRKGKRRTANVWRNDYGRQIMVEVDFIDVTIPFTGWPKSFSLMPSSCALIDTKAEISGDGLVVSFPDDQNLDRSVDDFIKQVSANLQNLKKDLAKIKPQTLQVAQFVANERLAQIKARNERDKARSFPIE